VGIISMPFLSCMQISFHLYGDVARDEPMWRAWMNEHFPAAGDTTKVT